MQHSINIHLKAVVFDWDLTLWNSWDIHTTLMNQTADMLGYPQPTAADLGAEYSRPFLEHLAWFFPGNKEIVLDTYMDCYNDAVWQERRLYTGILELIKLLKDNGYRTAILSDKRESFGVPELEHSGLVGLIDRVMFFSDGVAPKPDPSGLQELIGGSP